MRHKHSTWVSEYSLVVFCLLMVQVVLGTVGHPSLWRQTSSLSCLQLAMSSSTTCIRLTVSQTGMFQVKMSIGCGAGRTDLLVTWWSWVRFDLILTFCINNFLLYFLTEFGKGIKISTHSFLPETLLTQAAPQSKGSHNFFKQFFESR